MAEPSNDRNAVAPISTAPAELPGFIAHNRPSLLIRKGNFIILMLLLFVVVLSWFISFPDVIRTSARLTSANSPKRLTTTINGKIAGIYVSENQAVEKGQMIAALESTADAGHVLWLAKALDSLKSAVLGNIPITSIELVDSLNLGELQVQYQVFTNAYLAFVNYLPDGFYSRKMEILRVDMMNLKRLRANLTEQIDLQRQELALVQKDVDINHSLLNSRVISESDFRSEQSKLLLKKMSLPQMKSALIANETQQSEKKREMLEIENAVRQQKIIFLQAINTLASALEDWKKKFLLISPVKGRIAFASRVMEDQDVHVSDTICYVNPVDSIYYADVTIPQANFGKVAIGQKVLLRFHSNPSEQFGTVIGELSFISQVAAASGYKGQVVLKNGLKTTHGVKIKYHDGLKADADIITNDTRLLERVYFRVIRHLE